MILSFEEMRNICLWPNWNGEEELPLTPEQINSAEVLWNQFPRSDVDVTHSGLISIDIPVSNKQIMIVIFAPQFHQFALFVDDVMNLEKENIENSKVSKTITSLQHLMEFYKWYKQGR